MTDGLFDVEELVVPHTAGRVEAGLGRALEVAVTEGVVVELDAGLVAGALVAARALDRAEGLPDKSAVYAVAQLMRPYQDALHALRLPAEVAPTAGPRLPDTAAGADGPPSWLGDAFGPS